MTDPVLAVRDLVVRFRTGKRVVHAVNGVSFELEAAGALGLVGESGSGKSVTSLAILRLLPRHGWIERGEVRFEGRDLLTLSDAEMRTMRGARLSMVLQDPLSSLNPVLSIGEQIEEAIRAHADVSTAEARRRAAELLAAVGIARPNEQFDRFPHQFSGGMRQRVMIATALALRPTVLIADEPTTALDVTVQAQVLDLLRTLTAEMGTAIVLISHDLGVMARMTKEICVMYAGFVVERAPTEEIFRRPTHPYTVGLLRSIPHRGVARGALHAIDGAPPDLEREPVGCPFAPRCAWRVEACWREMPPLAPVEDAGHLLACHHPVTPGEAAAGRPLDPGFAPAPPPGDVAVAAALPEATP
ncbi:MAG: ABC transporter ATP-binding protein [Actinomycetota bacterium]